MNYNTIQDTWEVPASFLPFWQKARKTHRLVPMLVWLTDVQDPSQKVLRPADYADVLPGALVEVHFNLHLHAWGKQGFFTNKITQIVVWERGTPTPQPPSIYDELSLEDGPYRKPRQTNNAVSAF